MSEVAEAVARVWSEGVGPDDVPWIASQLEHAGAPAAGDEPALGELRLFGVWIRLTRGELVTVPVVAHPPVAAVVAAAARVLAARVARDVPGLETAVEHLERALAGVFPGDPRGAAARAWADLALADVALAVTDADTARRRLEAVAADGAPIAFRITATLRLAALAGARYDVAAGRALARKATQLAEAAKRPSHASSARFTWALYDYMADDPSAMRATLAAAIANGDTMATVLLANVERAGRAMELLADGLRIATERNDPMAYMMCILVGARRYVKIGRDADALVTITAGMAQLAPIAPELSAVLAGERARWKETWLPARYASAERKAYDSLAEN